MTPAVAARVRQLEAERDYRASVAEWHARRAAERQQRINALLAELVAALSQLPIEPRNPRAVTACACGCGEQFEERDAHGRARQFRHGHNSRVRSAA